MNIDTARQSSTSGGYAQLRRLIEPRLILMFASLIILAIGVHYFSEGVFLAPRNISLLMRQASIVGVVACGVAILIIMSEIDLSIGSAVYLVGVVVATMENKWDMPIVPVMIAAIVCGLLIGLWNGIWVCIVGLPSFIATLAGLLAFRGVGLYATDARTISPLSKSHVALSEAFIGGSLSLILIAVVFAIAALFILRSAWRNKAVGDKLANAKCALHLGLLLAGCAVFTYAVYGYRGIPTAILWTFGVALSLWFITARTVIGRNFYMIGANRVAAQLAGINVQRTLFSGFLIMGALYGVAGLLFTARLNASTPNDGVFLELDAIAAAVIGGVALSGGKGNIPAVLAGALMLTAIDNAMSVMGMSSFLQQMVKGLILLAAVALDVRSRKR